MHKQTTLACKREIGLKATLVNPMCIEESKEYDVEE
jgi:hypothetical protein